jgi:hypothetical protein
MIPLSLREGTGHGKNTGTDREITDIPDEGGGRQSGIAAELIFQIKNAVIFETVSTLIPILLGSCKFVMKILKSSGDRADK